MFAKLLVANRGEIACRVMRTARRMGIATVAVYSDADADALHVAMADQARRVGPPAPRDSYLNIAAVIAAARDSGAEALHPGYGFLSENPLLPEACEAAGIVFVGPPASAMRAMGGKSEAKALMERAGVPLVPGYHGTAQDEAVLVGEARRIGFPVLIKASAGGGGKGMRVVEQEADLPAAILAAKREAVSSFGDDRLLIERYLTRPRHIEIQVFGDTHGNIVSLFERDCSVQRRHQKIIEEAPAPGMLPAMRAAMGQAAVAAARAVGYVGAGTVEFIVEGEDFHFMEMNTRLQVEHPVTEAITGQDLVEWQFRVAAGERLPLLQDDLAIDGHAFEVRLYAEDATRNFMPSVGTLTHLVLAADARIETGVRAGDRITPDYDPMIAKLIVHGGDRAAALRRLAAALDRCEVAGVRTNLPLLRRIAVDVDFAAGDVDTGFIGRRPALLAPAEVSTNFVAAAALAALTDPVQPAADPYSPWGAADGWRLNLPGSRKLTLQHDDMVYRIEAEARPDGCWALRWDGMSVLAMSRGGMLRLDGVVSRMTSLSRDAEVTVMACGAAHIFAIVDPLAPPAGEAASGARVAAPIPARVAGVLVAAGDAVQRGQALIVVEAMKMEMTLSAPRDGVVAEIRCGVGDLVAEGVELVSLESEPVA